ncbi:hypothetical protein BGW38_006887 [Lunasporangiospora selenospora]|uniref:Uncharacterized protein n=1 Tax=Lunasporangiospora selenospora TaxID=979761 RepID=A0A9P6FYT8_9FUNG|nr:hypothetical protein BGW38_006887 [Lunasporangiospora selenospora]
MSDLRTILDRLVQENLHGPINAGTQGQSNNDHNHSIDEDMDAGDPRWRQLFQEFFVSESSDDRNDDLLFFVQKIPDRDDANAEATPDPVFVKRKIKGAGLLSLLSLEQEAIVLWKDTFFLNVIVQLHCKLTVAVCSRVAVINPTTGITKSSMICTRKHVSKRVYALPTKARMDVKEESVECSWPSIYYVIDDFEDMFEQVMVQENEYLCVELAVTIPSTNPGTTPSGSSLFNPASPMSRRGSGPSSPSKYQDSRKTGHDNWDPISGEGLQEGRPFPAMPTQGSKVTLFQGAAGFSNLLDIYQHKAAPKIGRRFKFGPHTIPTEFILMRGPGKRGGAQVAVTASHIRDDPSLDLVDTPLQYTKNNSGTQTWSSASTGAKNTESGSAFAQRQQSRREHRDDAAASPTIEKSLPPVPNQGDRGRQPPQIHSGLPPGQHTQEPYTTQSTTHTTSSNNKLHPTSQTLSGSSPSPPPKSFSTGSFFQSLRRISLATLAQAVSGMGVNEEEYSHGSSHVNNQGLSAGQNDSLSPTNAQGVNGAGSQQQLESPERHQPPHSSGSSRYGVTTGSSISSLGGQDGGLLTGAGTRYEIEALVRQPQSLRCCMTFVNVPWTSIAIQLMEHAHRHRRMQSNPPRVN